VDFRRIKNCIINPKEPSRYRVVLTSSPAAKKLGANTLGIAAEGFSIAQIRLFISEISLSIRQIKPSMTQLNLSIAQESFSITQIKPSSARKSLNIWISGGRMPPSKAKNPRKRAGLSDFLSETAFLVDCGQTRVAE
jgi:hypothetical protein